MPVTSRFVRGIVVQDATHTALAGALVEFLWRGSASLVPLARATTDTDGKFSAALPTSPPRRNYEGRGTVEFRVSVKGVVQKILPTSTAAFPWDRLPADIGLCVEAPEVCDVPDGVDDPTGQNPTVRGRVRHRDGSPVQGSGPLSIQLQVWHIGFAETLLAPTGGAPAIEPNGSGVYVSEYAIPQGHSGPINLQVRVRVTEGGVTTDLVKSAVAYNAATHTRIDIDIDDERLRRKDEYSALLATLTETPKGVALADLDDPRIDVLAGETKIDRALIATLVAAEAAVVALDLGDIPLVPNPDLQNPDDWGRPGEAVFGLFRQGWVQTPQGVLRGPRSSIPAVLSRAADAVQISRNMAEAGEAVVEIVNEAAASQLLAETEPDSFGKLLGAAGISTIERRTKFARLWVENTGTMSEFWAAVEADADFDAADVAKIKDSLRLNSITQSHVALVKGVGSFLAGQAISKTGGWKDSDWDARLDDTVDGQPVGVPTWVPGADAAEKRANYKKILLDNAELSFPSVRFRARMTDPATSAFSAGTRQWLENNPNPDITKDHFPYFDGGGSPDPVAIELRRGQRLYKVAPKTGRDWAVKKLMEAGYTSASSIARRGKGAFTGDVAQAIPSEEAGKIHARARAASAAALQLYFQNVQATQGQVNGGQYLSGLSEDDYAAGAASIPDYETLFGNTDYCACRDCRSILGPAAYLVDLIRFAEDHGLWSAISARRSDIGTLKLSCANSTTTLPHVDLLIEILENVVAGPGNEIDHDETTWTAPELLGRPEYRNALAYSNLAMSWYPASSPFDLGLEVQRAFLRHLGLELADLHRLMGADLDPARAPGWAAETLGLTNFASAIVTGGQTGGIWQTWSDAELAAALFGYGTPVPNPPNPPGPPAHAMDTADRDDLAQVPEFLRRTQLSLEQLLDLLHCRTANVLQLSPTGPDDATVSIANTEVCDIDAWLLIKSESTTDEAPTAARYKRLGLFLMLWRNCGWTMRELDAAMRAIGVGSATSLTVDHLAQLAAIRRLQAELSLPFDELIALFGVLDTREDRAGNEPELRPLYDRLFLDRTTFPDADSPTWTYALNTMRDTLASGTPPQLATQTANLAAAFRTSTAEIDVLVAEIGPSQALSLARISAVARGVFLARALRLSTTELVRGLTISGALDPTTIVPATPRSVETWLAKYRALADRGLTPVNCAHFLSDEEASGDDAALGAVQPAAASVTLVAERGRAAAWAALTSLWGDAAARETATADLLNALAIPSGPATIEYILEFLQGGWLVDLDAASGGYLTNLMTGPGVLANHVDAVRFEAFLVRRGSAPNYDPPWLTAAGDRFVWLLLELLRQHPASAGAFVMPDSCAALLSSARQAIRDELAAAIEKSPELVGAVAAKVPDFLEGSGTPAPLDQLVTGANAVDVFLAGNVLIETGTPTGTWAAPPPAVVGDTIRWMERVLGVASRLGYDLDAVDAWREFASPLAIVDAWTLPAGGSTPADPADWEGLVALVAWTDAFRATPFRSPAAAPLGSATDLPLARIDSLVAFAETWTSGAGQDVYLAARTEWTAAEIASAISSVSVISGVSIAHATSFARLVAMMKAAGRSGASTARIAAWPGAADSIGLAEEITAVARSRHGTVEAWAAVARPIRDRIRERQQRCLTDWVIANDPDVSDEATLYGHYLIDPAMGPWLLTSRVKQAAASIQLFVQRAQLGLEGSLGAFDEEARRRWEWKKNYRVWEAARKVFLYPENWLEPELRDDRTPFFQSFESAIGQQALAEPHVEGALVAYLRSLHDVHDLKILATATDAETETTHVLARTWADPPTHWYRARTGGTWSPWERLDVEAGTGWLAPVVIGRELVVFWLTVGDGGGSELASVRISWVRRTGTGAWAGVRHSDAISYGLRDEDLDTLTGWSVDVAPPIQGDSVEAYRGLRLAVEPPDAAHRVRVHVVRHPSAIGLFYYLADPGELVEIHPENEPWMTSASFEYDAAMDAASLVTAFEGLPAYLQHTPDGWNWDTEGQADVHNGDGGFASLAVVAHQGTPESHLPPSWEGVNGETTTLLPVQMAQLPWLGSMRSVFPRIVPAWNGWDPFVAQCAEGSFLVTRSGPDSVATAIIWESVEHPLPNFRFHIARHPYTREFIEAAAEGSVNAVLAPEESGVAGPGSLARQARTEDAADAFEATFQPTAHVVPPYPVQDIDFRLTGAYSVYNWEVFFHAPLLVALRYARQQRFEQALRWLRFIFDPMNRNTAYPVPARYWKVRPLMASVGAAVTDWIAFTGVDGSEEYSAFQNSVDAWLADPFNPYAVARLRPGTFQKHVFMRFVDVLIGWGDQLFRRETIESIQEATQYYVLAATLLGPRPAKLPEQGASSALSYNELQSQGAFIDAFSNPIVQIENGLPESEESSAGDGSPLAGYGDLAAYFCVPPNAKLLGYWDTVADRLWKLRTGLNIAGVRRDLPLYEPPIDPALLVRARAMGLDLNSVLNNAAVSRPAYRFSVTLGKAQAFVSGVKALGGALLAALEKRDAEKLAHLRARHELELLRLTTEVRRDQVKEARHSLDALRRTRDGAAARLARLDVLIAGEEGKPGQISQEIQRETHTKQSSELSIVSQHLATAAGLLSLIPQLSNDGIEFGGVQVSAAVRGAADVFGILSAVERIEADRLLVAGDQRRRLEEWQHQRSQTSTEIAGLDKQLLAAEIRLAVAEKELANQVQQVEQSREVEDFLRTKFTNRDLYDWMVGETASLYFGAYELAYDLAKKAQLCFAYEVGVPDPQVVRFGHWDDLHRGLLAGERLGAELDRLDRLYFDADVREHEMTKDVSLAQLDPAALLDLIETGACEFTIPESVYDLDVPGHYFRRIQSVSVTIATSAGRDGAVHARLSLESAAVRRGGARPGTAYQPIADPVSPPVDPQIVSETGIGENIVLSGAQDDAGVFQLNLQDPRYLPFEKRGAVSSWSLALTSLAPAFDRGSISDVVVRIRYTARFDEVHAGLVTSFYATGSPFVAALLAMSRDFPDEFHALQTGTGTYTVALPQLLGRLPYAQQLGSPAVEKATILVRSASAPAPGATFQVGFGASNLTGATLTPLAGQWYSTGELTFTEPPPPGSAYEPPITGSGPSVRFAINRTTGWAPTVDATVEVLVLLTNPTP